jgi:uncharacterized protein (TIGR02217 family)
VAFIESPRFPDRLAYGAMGGPAFSTSVVTSASGAEARNAEWAYPLHSWDVSQGINGQADWQVLRAFFMAAGGKRRGWRFKDWTDYQASHTGDEAGVATALTATTFQMVKRYTSGSLTQDRIIYKPVAGTVEVKVSAVVDGTASVDATTGVITIASAPAASAITWSGQFDVPMRFDTDALQARVVARNLRDGLLHEWGEIPIVELLNP